MSPQAQPYPRRWQALIVLALSLVIVTLDNTILNVALPTIREDLDASSSELQWIVDSYLLVFAGLLLAAGTLGDRFGRRRALFTGLGVFGLGSFLAATSGSSTELIASRALMGVGAAAIMPTTLSILTNVFPKEERPKAIAIWAAASGIGIAIGPITGGWLIEHFDWSSVFLVNLPIVAGCLVAGAVLIPESRDAESPRLDLAGIGLSIVGLTAVVWALIEAPERGWTSTPIVAAFATGAVILAAFVAWERHTPQPMLDVSVFRNMRFTAANVSITFVFFALMGVMYFLTTYLQSVMGYSALQAGLRMAPIAAGLILAAKLSVILTARFGTKAVVAGGLLLVGISLGAFTAVEVTTPYFSKVAGALTFMGVGMGLAMAPATEAIMGSLPKAKAGIGSAMNDVVREVGGTLGVAVLGSIVSSGYASGMDGATSKLPHEAAEAAGDSVGGAHEVAGEVGGSAGAKLIALADQSFVEAMTTAAGLAAGVALAGALIAAAFLPSRARAEASSSRAEAPEAAAA
ncbi:MAG TPA: MFS transporter [Thermoleophilaceae bacterium]|nr:MFS transporter [Thermoleophilaceae bacterium]